MKLPKRTASYKGPLTDTSIWEKFDVRPSDVFVVTPPKSGTTWTQILVTSLIAGRLLTPKDMGVVSPWLDCALEDPEENKATLDAQTFRRCIKSHTPFDGIPYSPDCAYLAVYRHPIDVHFSMRKHAANMQSDVMRVRYPEDVHEAFQMFLMDELYDGSNDALDLHSIAYHYHGFAQWDHLQNVHLFHYADMVADLPGTVQRLVRILGLQADASLVDEIVEGATFANLKKTAKTVDRGSENAEFYLSARFFDSGTSNKWTGKLTDSELEAFDKRIRELLPENLIPFLLWGSKGTP